MNKKIITQGALLLMSLSTAAVLAAVEAGPSSITAHASETVIAPSSTSVFPFSGQIVEIQTNLNGSRAMDYTNLGQIVLWDKHGGDNQRWIIVPDASGNFRIKNVTVEGAYLTGNGTVNLREGESTKSKYSLWKFESLGNDNYTIVNVGTGEALDAEGGNSGNGTSIISWKKSGSTNQSFKIKSVENAFVSLYHDANASGTVINEKVSTTAVSQLSTTDNDKISSIVLPPSMKITLYADANYQGTSLTLSNTSGSSKTYNLTDSAYNFNDKVSSYKISLNPSFSGTISGRVDGVKTTGLSNAHIDWRDSSGSTSKGSVWTEANGSYSIPKGAKAGDRLIVSATDYNSYDFKLTAEMINSGVVNLELDRSTVELKGHLTDPLNTTTKLSGAKVELINPGQNKVVASTTTDSQGNYSLKSAWRTDNTLKVTLKNYETKTLNKSVTMKPGTTTTQNVDMNRTQGGVIGFVLDTNGKPVSGAKITLRGAGGDVFGTATTDFNGYYFAISSVWFYSGTITAEKDGKSSTVKADVTSSGNAVNITLEAAPPTPPTPNPYVSVLFDRRYSMSDPTPITGGTDTLEFWQDGKKVYTTTIPNGTHGRYLDIKPGYYTVKVKTGSGAFTDFEKDVNILSTDNGRTITFYYGSSNP